MKQLLFTLIIISILTGCKTEKQESKKGINPLPINTYFQNSELPAAIMGYSNKEGQMKWYAYGPSVWGGKDTINENNISFNGKQNSPIQSQITVQKHNMFGFEKSDNNDFKQSISEIVSDILNKNYE